MEKNSYITVLSTENYLTGVLCLVESLRRTNTKYPINVLITDDISLKTEELLRNCDLGVIRKSKIDIPKSIKNKNDKGIFSHWTNTFDKLLIFELIQFDKLVYLDSDMYIRKNIDELFERENMSAVIDRRIGPIISEDWIKLTSGLMVIEPKKDIIFNFKNIIANIEDKRESIGDQDILQEYDTQWGKKEELHLDVKYNMFFPHIDYYTHCGNYTLDDIYIVHFIYNKKPFHISYEQIPQYFDFIENRKKNCYEKNKIKVVEDYMLCGNEDEKKVLEEYFSILENIRMR